MKLCELSSTLEHLKIAIGKYFYLTQQMMINDNYYCATLTLIINGVLMIMIINGNHLQWKSLQVKYSHQQ